MISVLTAVKDRLRQPLLLSGSMNGVGVGLAVLTSLILARTVPPYEYGQLIYFYSLAGLLRLFFNFGLGTSISRDAAASWFDRGRLSTVVYSFIVGRLLISLAGTLLIVAIGSVAAVPFLGYLVVTALMATLADFTCAVVSGSRSAWRVGLTLLIQPVAYFTFATGLALFGKGIVRWLMVGYAASFAVTALIGVILIASTRALGAPRPRFIQPGYILKGAMGFIIPSYLVGLIATAWGTAATSAFGWLGEFDSAAAFGVAFTGIGMPVSVIGPAILNTYYPQASYLYRRGQEAELRQYLGQTISVLAPILIWVAVIVFAFADTAVVVLFGRPYASSGAYARFLSPMIVSMGILPVFTLTLLAVGRPWRALVGLSLQVAVLAGFLLWEGSTLTPAGLGIALILSGGGGTAIQWALMRAAIGTGAVPRSSFLILAAGILIALVLRFAASAIGTMLSPWHFVLGVSFTILYAFALALSGQLRLRAATG